MEDQIKRLKDLNDQNAARVASDARHQDLVASNIQTQETIVRSFSILLDYLERRVSKTEVVNQLTEIGTPDVGHVVSAINSLHDTLGELENTDLSEVTSVMRELLEETKKIPKELPDQPEQKFVDYTEQFKSLTKAIEAVEKVVKEQKLVAEAPVVNVPQTEVNVEPPDLEPLKKEVAKLLKATKDNKPPLEGDSVRVHQTNNLVSEKFDEYKIIYDSFVDDDEPRVEGIDYFLKKKKVASLRYSYDDNGNLLGGKRI